MNVDFCFCWIQNLTCLAYRFPCIDFSLSTKSLCYSDSVFEPSSWGPGDFDISAFIPANSRFADCYAESKHYQDNYRGGGGV